MKNLPILRYIWLHKYWYLHNCRHLSVARAGVSNCVDRYTQVKPWTNKINHVMFVFVLFAGHP